MSKYRFQDTVSINYNGLASDAMCNEARLQPLGQGGLNSG